MFTRLLRYGFITLLVLGLFGAGGLAGLYAYLAPTLPDTESLKEVRLQVPLRVYSRGGELIAEFGEKKRIPLRYQQFPPKMIQALLAAEDDRFFEHPGVDYQGLLRAAYHLLRTGEKGQGGSTITMQVARNFFLSSEKTYLRKISEIFLSLRIEQDLTKEEILELYLNKVYLGQRAYGFAAAAQVYYGKDLGELTTAQYAMLAGLPKAPSTFNPVVNPQRARIRRDYVLRRMEDLGYISATESEQSQQEPVTASVHQLPVQVQAAYLAEMVRAELVARFGEEAYSRGIKVFTTVEGKVQNAANSALRQGLLDYDVRHGFRGAEAHLQIPEQADLDMLHQQMSRFSSVADLLPGVVVAVQEKAIALFTRSHGIITVGWDGLSWAAPYIDDDRKGAPPRTAGDIVKVGDVVRVRWIADQPVLTQLPTVSGALVSLRPEDGAVTALAGGFDFYHSKFNRATQASRQPGSNFKPFIYSAALDKGFTPATLVNDAPVVFADDKLESEWRPENYSGRFYGPTRLREALVRSRNLVSIRVLQTVGIGAAIRHLGNFGFTPARLPRDLSLALGSATVTPFELARGYAVLANGGFLIEPYFIQRIEDDAGNLLYEADPAIACAACEEADASRQAVEQREPATEQPAAGEPQRLAPRTLHPQNAYLITSIMQDVIRRGTGRRAMQLGRSDLAGKTGTTNDQRDAWFSGYNHAVVTTVWVGFDNPRPLGNRETGAGAALPIWVDFMGEALKGVPDQQMAQPPGMVTVRIDPETGEFATADNPHAIFETFRAEDVPKRPTQTTVRPASPGTKPAADLQEQLF